VPFGGKKQSGIGTRDQPFRESAAGPNRLLLGRELGSHALDEYISTKAVHWNYGENIEWPL
jgi:aldehyde dehydrogenase (NAD+)